MNNLKSKKQEGINKEKTSLKIMSVVLRIKGFISEGLNNHRVSSVQGAYLNVVDLFQDAANKDFFVNSPNSFCSKFF